MICIGCIRLAHASWSNYFRLEFLEDNRWRKTDGHLPLWASPVPRGGWLYTRQGNLALIPEDGSLGVVLFRQVHWNWQMLTRKSIAALTGKGIRRTLTGETAAQLVWVLGDQIVARYEFPPDEIKGGRTTVVNAPAVPHPIPVDSPTGELFSIRCLGGVRASATAQVAWDTAKAVSENANKGLFAFGSVGSDYLVFEITDLQNGRVATYKFRGPELGFGFSIPSPLSPPLPALPQVPLPGMQLGGTLFGPTGEPTPFSTTRPQKLEDFAGDAMLMNSNIRLGILPSPASAAGLALESPKLSSLPGCKRTVVQGKDGTDVVAVDIPSVSTGAIRVNVFSSAPGRLELAGVQKKP